MTAMHRILAASGPVGQDTYTIEFSCPWGGCSEVRTMTVPAEAYRAWRDGAFVQVAFPDLSADEREVLLTGYCSTHMAIVFAPPTEDDGEDFYYEDEDDDFDDVDLHEAAHAIERAGGEPVDRRWCQCIGCKYGDH